MDPRRPDKQQKYKPPAQNNNAAPGEDLTPDYMNILDSSRKRSFSKCSERFKVVKIESSEPFKRGRWQCMDFLDQSYSRIAHYNSVMYKTSDTNINQSISSESWEAENAGSSMLQIFQQQNLVMALDENNENISNKVENYVCNTHGNYILLPGMISSSLVGIKYPFELNFLPISTSEHNSQYESSESELKSVHSQNSLYSFHQEYNNDLFQNNLNENQVCDQVTMLCQNGSKQINPEFKMSNGNVHYISQNTEIQSTQENHIQSSPVTREPFNNVAQNLNVIQNMNKGGNIEHSKQHKEIKDSSFPQNIIPPTIYQQQIPQDFNNVNQNNQNINQNQEFQNINSVNNIQDIKMCNIQGINNQNYNSEQPNVTYQSGNGVEVKSQLINNSINTQNIRQNNLTVRTHTFDVVPEINNQNQNIYNNNQFNKPVTNSNNNQDISNAHEDIKYCSNVPQNFEAVNQNSMTSNGQCHEIKQNVNQKSSSRQQNRQVGNEQVIYQQNNYPEKNIPIMKEDIPFTRPLSARVQEDQKSKYSNYTSQPFAFIPDNSNFHSNNSQTSVNCPNPILSPPNPENVPVFLDQTQLFMPVYPVNQSSCMQNMYLPVFSSTVQIPIINGQSTSLCENLSETALTRKPIGYQRILVPPNVNSNVLKRTNQFSYQISQTRADSSNNDSFIPQNNEQSPRSECTSSLDGKIEALMDLVKKHIKFAVVEDIHSLKQKIVLLKERVAQLEFENDMLKNNLEEYKKIKDKLAG